MIWGMIGDGEGRENNVEESAACRLGGSALEGFSMGT